MELSGHPSSSEICASLRFQRATTHSSIASPSSITSPHTAVLGVEQELTSRSSGGDSERES